jgi:DNA primase
MKYEGRHIDPVALWQEFTEIPANSQGDSPFISGLHCPNPEHSNSRLPGPFQINVTQPLVHCFAHCGISGRYEHAIQVITGCNYKEAKRKILKHSRLSSSRKAGSSIRHDGGRVRESNAADDNGASLDYSTYLPPVAIEYLASRGIGNQGISSFGIGWDSETKRIVIPARDLTGTLKFVIKRAISEKEWTKYLNLPEHVSKTSLLFGACVLDRRLVQSSGLILVEGPLDCIRMHEIGFKNTVAILGSKLSTKQRNVIAQVRPKKVYCFFDKDVAGVRATISTKTMLPNYPLFVIRYPKDRNDPAEMSRKEVEKQIHRALPMPFFLKDVPVALKRKEKTNGKAFVRQGRTERR